MTCRRCSTTWSDPRAARSHARVRALVTLAMLAIAAPVAIATEARCAWAAPSAAPSSADTTRVRHDAAARRLLMTGRYDEARAAYQRLASADPVTAAIGIARCRRAVGDLDEAARTLAAAIDKDPGAAAARAELAAIEFERGRYPAAQAQIDAALKTDPDRPAARWLAAELHRVAGRLDEAKADYLALVRLYNRGTFDDPDDLRWIGLGAAQYARWDRNSGQFSFLVNTLYPDALKADSSDWPAHLEAALLFIEKYNRPDANDELDLGLAINPRAAELHAARALAAFREFSLDSARASVDRALAIDPRSIPALRVRADVELVTAGPRAAAPTLERARALNPVDEETLGRLAAAYGAIDGLRTDPAGTRMGVAIAEAVGRNPHCGEFFAALAASLDLLGKYPAAARWYEEARRRMPQLVQVPGQLGLVEMRLGDETRARAVLDTAFDLDPFNVRVKNSIAVLELLENYGTLSTPHFVVRFDRSRDSLLAAYAARHLEDDVYPEVVKRMGYAPRERSLFEIFSGAKGETGHRWFSARMVGLPFVGTVGACAGKVVAMASPGDGARKFSWARVLRHEFVHVVNLQQTDFNIPRWYTEALAVRLEGPGTPRAWEGVLARRVAADSLFDLSTISLGFVRPGSGEDWALAYCQAERYARYIADTYGEGGLAKMIDAYRDNLDTGGALKRCFGITTEAFEKGYRRYLDQVVGPTNGKVDVAAAEALRHAAEAALNGRRFAEAESLMAVGRHRFPYAADWQAGRLAVLHETGNRDSLAAELADRAAGDSDDLAIRDELCRLAADRGDLDAAGRWAREAIGIDVGDAKAHAILARSLAGKDAARSIAEWETAVALDAASLEWRMQLAKQCAAAGRRDRARQVLNEILARDGSYPGAKDLLGSLGR